MFRAKLTLLFFFCIVFVLSVVWVVLDANRETYVEEQVLPSLTSGEESFRVLSDLRTDTLKRYVADIKASDLPAYIQILREFRGDIRRLGDRTQEEFRSRRNVPPEKILAFVEGEAKEALARFETTIAQRAKSPLKVAEGYPKYVRDVFASCLAESDPWSLCFFKLTYLPLTQIIFPQQRQRLGAALPELFVLVDSDGRTTRLIFDDLDKSVERLRVSDPGQAASGYRNHIRENFQQTAPVLEQLKTSFEPTISSFVVLGNRAFVVVASRLEGAGGEFLGAVIVGYETGRGRASKDTMTILGLRPTLARCMNLAVAADAGGDVASQKRCEYELSRLDKGILFLHVDNTRRAVIGSPVPGGQHRPELAQYLREGPINAPLRTKDLVATSVLLPLDFVPEGSELWAVLYVDLENALPGFATIKVFLVVSGIVIFLLSLIILQVFLRSFTRPFERIDAGIHEIIGGNFDYSFPFDFSAELPRSMAQSLTIMKAVLLGQPLPEDVERDDSWARDLRTSGSFGTMSEADAEPLTDTESGGVIEEIRASEVTESATEYYKRLFKEYVDARRGAGQDVSSITYIKFVEKVARTEKSLREKYDCKQIIFKVVRKEKLVALIPMKVTEDSATQA